MDGEDPPGNPPRRRRGGGEARSFLASARAVTAAAALLDGSVALFDLQKRRREEEELEAEIQEQRQFEDVQRLTGHIESLLHFQDDFYKRENQAHGQVEQLKESLLTLEDDHCLLQLQSNHQLSQLQSQIEKMRSEALSWVPGVTAISSLASELTPNQMFPEHTAPVLCETQLFMCSQERQWNHIQETAAQKTLLLGRIKMATFNLYEMTDAMVEGEHTLTMNDTEKQLEKVQMFIRDYEGLVKYQ
ncbi:Coiled-coil domain-containing protein 42 [Liparis tanakae]|uniref:Coiled-coil domain-containing protein 42 n=1 Tax=Liparis tanakae TaxID=230148 RepID=A0A4Z2FQX2_9TELE|nr:Coiled-coil domain-containing protein 42 [Liparis tanakae]